MSEQIHYVTNDELRPMVRQAKRTGQLGEGLIAVVTKIATGLHARYCFSIEREDYVQECLLLVTAKVRKIRVSEHIFNYLTTLCFNRFHALYRDQRCYRANLAGYADQLRHSDQAGDYQADTRGK